MDFSKFDYDNLTDVQMNELYTLANETITNPDINWNDEAGMHYFKIVDENDDRFSYFDEIRIQMIREMVQHNNPHLRKTFSSMMGVNPMLINLQKIEMSIYIFLHVRGTEEHLIIKVKV